MAAIVTLRAASDDIGEPDHARDRQLDAFELADRHVELAADARVGAGREHRCLRTAGGIGGQRDAAPDRELLDQHAPALAGHLDAADDGIERHEHVAPAHRSVLERNVERQVTLADLDAGGFAPDQRAGDAEVGLAAEQPVGIEHAKGQAYYGGDWRESNVALGEVQAEPEYLAALPHAAADHAGIRDRGGIGADARAGEREAGNVIAARQPRQVMILLLLGAVVVQQFRGTERIGHRDRRGAGDAAAGQLHQHAGMRVGRETQAAVLLADDHREEAARLEEGPHLRRQVAAPVRDVEVIEHPAQLIAGAVEEGLLFGRQAWRRNRAAAWTSRACR